MTILSGDIKLVASQVMDDVDEGGGAPVATVITDGASNELFNDISEVDRAGGRVNLRKVFAGVHTNNTDTYLGANVIVADPPDDPRVSVTLFSTDDAFDTRIAAQSRIESYLAPGATYAGYLFGNHISGQMTITLLTRTNISPPVIGETFVLRKNEGLVTEVTQYVRVTTVSTQIRTFQAPGTTDEFDRLEVTLGVSDALRSDFPGFDALLYDSTISYTGKTKIYETIVADAARYYGASPLAVAASIGDFTIQAESIYTQLVPSAQIETPIVDARMNQQSAALVSAGAALTLSLTMAFSVSQSMYIGGGILPGSLSITRGGIVVTDLGGKLINAADSSQVGLVDYANGVASLTVSVFGTSSGTHAVQYTPAAAPTIVTETFSEKVTAETQRLSWIFNLDPIPARGSVQVSYRTGGRWYVLQDDGSGAVRGSDSAYGAGTINFTTGSLVVTLGALPDVGGKLIVAYAPAVVAPALSSVPQPASGLNDRLFFTALLSGVAPIKPGTLTISWNDGTARSATDSGGGFVGDGIGEVFYPSGLLRFSPNVLPASGTTFTYTLTQSTPALLDVAAFTDSGGWAFSLGGSVLARTVELGIAVSYAVRAYPGVDFDETHVLRVFDDGAGNLQISNYSSNLTVGTVNYSSGACTLAKTVTGFIDVQSVWETKIPAYATAPLGDKAQYTKLTGTEQRSLTLTILNGPGSATPTSPQWAWWSGGIANAARARFSGIDVGAQTYTADVTALVARGQRLLFRVGGREYRRDGNNIVSNYSAITGIGDFSGAYISGYSNDVGGSGYITGYSSVTLWDAGSSPVISASAGIQSPVLSSQLIDAADFRTATSPLKSGAFSIAGTFEDGTTFTASADTSGNVISGTAFVSPSVPGSYGVFGKVDFSAGVAELRFGRRVDPSHAGEDGVHDLSYMGVPAVAYVESRGVQADTLRYSASAYSYLPLDANLLGIDPVRLPSDGRVPIFRPGTFAVVGHTQITGPLTVSNTQVVDVGRVRLSRVRVLGNDGNVINTGYAADLDAGEITFTSVAGYSQPVTIEDRIEDMVLLSDAQINGQITGTRPLTHDYPLGSYVSSALMAGDVHARVSLTFDQGTWAGVFADSVSGAVAAGTYNTVLSPIEVTNYGAQTERWAIVFTNTTSFNVVGEHVGVIATGNTSADLAPINPATGQPYFTLRAVGWGAGWAAGNALRLNTVGANVPVWVVRTIQQGPETVPDDSFTLLIRGDVDTA